MHFPSYPTAIQDMITTLRQLPGIGLRHAERLAFALLQWPTEQLGSFCKNLNYAKSALHTCPMCGCWGDIHRPCWSCQNLSSKMICIVAWPKDAFAIYATGSFPGAFHVLGGLIDPIHEIDPQDLLIEPLIARVLHSETKELLLALDATLEGDATALYLSEKIETEILSSKPELTINRLAFGMPVNSALDLVDPATLAQAIAGKNRWVIRR